MYRQFQLAALLLLVTSFSFSQTTYYARADGNWNDANTWETTIGGGPVGTFPGNLDNDIAIIRGGNTVFYIVGGGGNASETIGSMSIGEAASGGTLVFFHGADGAVDDNYTLVISGDLTIDNTFSGGIVSAEGGGLVNGVTVPGTSFEDNNHELIIGGNLTLDDGSFDLESASGGSTNLTFNGTANQEITDSGSPTVEVAGDITFSNTGTAPANEIRISSDDFSNGVDADCSFTAGTIVHNNSGSFVNTAFNGAITVTSSVDFDIQDGEFTFSSINNDRTHIIQGNLTIRDGAIFNASTDTDAGDGDGATGDASNLTIEGDLTMSGSAVLNVSSEIGLPTIPANGADDGSLTLSATTTNDFTGCTSCTILTEVLTLNSDFAFENGTLFIGDDDGIAGSITLAANVDVDLDDVTFSFVGDDIVMNDNTTFEINNNGGSGGTYTIADDVDGGTVITMSGTNASFLVNSGTVNVAQNSVQSPIFSLTGTGASITVNTGGVLNILENSDVADVGILIGGSTQTILANGGTIDIGNTGSSSGRLQYNASTIDFNLTIQNGGTVSIGEDFLDSDASSINSTVTITGASSSLTIGDNADFDVLSVTDGSLTVQTENADGFNVELRDAGTITNATVEFQDGLEIEAGGSLIFNSGTLNIETVASTINQTVFQHLGSFTQNGGSVNVATNVTSQTGGATISLEDESIFIVNEGTFTVFNSFTDPTQYTNGTLLQLDDGDISGGDEGDVSFALGNGSGSATLTLAPNLGAAATVTNRDFFDIQGPNSEVIINTDGTLNVGTSSGNTSSNTGRFHLDNTPDGEIAAFVTINGTVNVAGDFTIEDGFEVTISSTGTLNVGLNDSEGANSIFFGNQNGSGGDAITLFTIDGGIVNMGDGAGLFDTGNGNNNPVFSGTYFKRVSIENDGILNVNGGLELSDAHVILQMTSGEINIDPQGISNFSSALNVFHLDRGFFDVTGGTITIVDPHASTGVGEVLHWNAVGDPSAADQIQVTNSSGWTLNIGDGVSSSEGSTDQFDFDIDASWILPELVINNPTGTNRGINFNGNTRNYLIDGNLTITAGTLDLETSTIDLDNNSSGNFVLGDGANLLIDGTGDHFPGSATESPTSGTPTSFGTYTIDAGSSVTYSGDTQTIDVPGGANSFGDLIIAGSGIKTLSNAESVVDSLWLQAGTLNASTNLTLGSGSHIIRSGGAFNVGDDIQGVNDYSISYTGSSQTSASEEYTGGGLFTTVTMNLDEGQTLTFHGTETIQDLALLEGTFADGGFTINVNGDVTNTASHTGSGSIVLTGGASNHLVTGDTGGGSFTNLTLNDANGATVSTDVTIEGVLTLTSGVFDIGSDELTFSSSGTVAGAFSASNMIQLDGSNTEDGVIKSFASTNSGAPITLPLGVAGKYTPVDIELISATGLGDLTIKPIDGFTATTDPADLELSYFWRLSSTISNPTVTLDFTYDPADVPGTANEVAFIPGRLSGATWDDIQDVSQVTGNVITFDNVDYITGDFTTAEPTEFGVVASFYSIADGNWNSASSWSTDGFGGSAGGTIPSTGQVVFIGNSRTITADASNLTAFSVEIQSTGTLLISDGTTGHDFGTVSGAGTLQIESNSATAPEFPGGEYSSFTGESGGTVVYAGTGSYSLPTQNTYNDLSFSGSGNRTFADADITINGDVNVANNGTTSFSDATNGDVSIAGTLTVSNGATTVLQFPENTARSITVGGDVTIDANAVFDVISSASVTHNLNIGGSLTNNGTFDMETGGVADVTFTGATSNSVSGSGTTFDFNRLIVNKGTSIANVLTLSSNNILIRSSAALDSKPIELQNGTLQINNNLGTFDLTSGGSAVSSRSFNIPATAALILNNASTTLQVTSEVGAGIEGGDLVLAGYLEINDGSVVIGDDVTGVTDNELLYAGTEAGYRMSGGSLTISGGFRVDRLSQSDTDINSTVIDFDMTGGTITTTRYRFVRDGRNSTNNNNDFDIGTTVTTSDEAGFEIVNASEFDMSDGTIIAVHGGASGGNDEGIPFFIGPNVTGGITGGSVQILNSGTPTAVNINLGFASGLPLWNLNIGDGTTFIGDIGGVDGQEIDLVVQNDFVLNLPSGEFNLYEQTGGEDAENYTLTIGGDFTITAGTFESGLDDTDADENDLIFNGTDHSITFTPADVLIHDITFGHSGTATINNDVNINGEWTYNTGTISLGANTVIFHENFNASNVATENMAISGSSFSFPNLTYEGDAGTVDLIANTDVSVTGTLTINNGVLDVTTNTLTVNTLAVGAGSFIATSGNETDGGVVRTFTTPTSEAFTYPLGINGVRRDVTATVTDAGTGTITVVPVASQNPFVSSTDALGIYWVITPQSFTSPTLSYTFNYVDPTDVNGTEADYAAATFDGSNFTIENGAGDSFDATGNTFTIANNNNGTSLQFLAGDDPDGFPAIETYFSRSAVCAGGCDWNTASSWSTDNHAGVAALSTPASNNPVIIADGDDVTITGSGAVSATTQLTSTATLSTTEIDNSGIGTLSGDGTLIIERDDDTDIVQGGGSELVLPSLTAGEGTVSYIYTNGTNGFNIYLPSTPIAYHNLSLGVFGDGANNPDFLIENIDYTVTGDVVLNDGEIVMDSDATLVSDGSGTFTLLDDADMTIQGENNFPSNFASYMLTNTGCLVTYNPDNNNDTQTILTTNNGGGTITYGDLDLEDNDHIFSGTLDVNGNLNLDNNNAGLSLGSNTLRIGGTLDFDGRNSTQVSGDPVFNSQTGTVIFDGGTAQSITAVGNYIATDTINFNNLTIEGAGTSVTFPSMAGVYTVGGNLTISNDATLDMTSQDLVLDGNFSNNSSNTNPFTNIDELILNGTSSDQDFDGSSSISIVNLTLEKTSGVDLNIGTPVTITGTLLMQNDGNIVLDGASDFDLTIASGATVTDNNSNNSFSANRQIEFDGTRTGTSELIFTGTGTTADSYDFYFPVGTPGTFSPVQFDVSTLNNAGGNSTVDVKPVVGNSSSATIGGGAITNFDETLAIDRYFIVNTDADDITGTFTFSYVDADINGDELDYVTRVWPGSGTAFEEPQTAIAVSTSSNNQALNQYGGSVSTFIDDATTEWITGTNASFTPALFSNGGGAWNVAASWNTASDGSGSSGIPSATTDVTIEDADIITMPNNVGIAILANTVTVGASASIDFTDPYDQANSALVDVNGTGTIVLDADPGLPATIDAADLIENGTVNYDFSGDGTERSLPSSITDYNNLTITDDTPADDATLQINTTVLGDLQIDGATLNTGSFTLEVRGSILAPLNSGQLDPSSGTLNLAGSSAQSVPAVVSNYNNLIFSNVGAKTIGAITVNDLTIFVGTGTVDGGTNTITVTGDWSGTSAFSQSGAGNVLFNNASGDQAISGTSSFHNLVVNKAADNVLLNGDISISADITLTSGTINSGSQSITFSGTAATQGFLGASSITLNDLIINKSTGTDFQYNSQVSSIGGSLTLTSGDFVSVGPTSLDIDGDFTLESGSTFNQSGTTMTSLTVGGSFTDNSSGGLALPTNIAFDGSTAQTVSSSFSFTNLTINNNAGVSTNQSQSVSGTLTLTSGVLDLDQDDGNRSDDPVLTIDPTSAIVGTFSDAVHIEGKIATSTTFNSDFLFPVGDNGNYRAITLNPDNLSDFSTVQHISETPPDDMPGDLPASFVSTLNNRYWDVVRNTGSGNVTVTVQLNTAEDGLSGSDLSSLALVRNNSGTWEAFLNQNSANNPAAATLTGVTTGFSEVGVASTDLDVNPLPVELLNFNGIASDDHVQLFWSTATELNNDYFEVHHSLDGESFDLIGMVDGNGTSNQLINYDFRHENPATGLNYYQLIQVDFDGTSEAHPIIQVENNFLGIVFSAFFYPNPANSSEVSLFVQTIDNHTSLELKVYDLGGKLYYQNRLDMSAINHKMDLSNVLSSGTYIVEIIQGNHYTREKMIIE